MKKSVIPLFICFLVACGSNGTAPVPLPNPTTPTNPDPNPTPADPDDPSQPIDGKSCTYVLSEDITVPSRLENTPAACDYLLEGFVDVSSTLTIDPGVVVVAKKDAIIWVDGGQIIAVGTPQQRIVMQGFNTISGYWDGIRFAEGRESQFEYFDLKDAGQVCSISWCPDAALILDDVTVSFANSSISNSYVHGLHMAGDVNLTKFENNRFYNNIWAGIVIDGNYAPLLDAASDYSGGAEPNGTPYVLIASGDQTEGREFRWKKLNTGYLIGSYFNVEGGRLVLEPGVEMVFDKEAWMWVDGNGVLEAVGTATEPIRFRGRVEQAGYWDGISFDDSPWEGNRLEYVDIRHAGNTEGLTNAFGGVRLEWGAQVYIANSTIADNNWFGVSCDDRENILRLGSGNTFSNNAEGDVDPDCRVTP